MKRNEIWAAVEIELRSNLAEKPNWPVHIVAQGAMVTDAAAGILSRAIGIKYSKQPAASRENEVRLMELAAIETIVAAIRLLESLDPTNKTDNQFKSTQS